MLKKTLRLLPYLATAAVLAGIVFLVTHRDQIVDWWELAGYEPPGKIATLAEDTTMTDYARRLFYVNKPTLDNKDAFNRNCAGVIEEAAVLGCYRGNRQGIHIYDVTDERLHGIEEVTAAHEMLHQAYERLSDSDRERVGSLLRDFYESGQISQSARDKLELYADESEDVLVNEMHSIFGTEVDNLPDELKEYYARYFDDRGQVLAFRADSRAAFDEYRAQIADFDRRIADLKQRIDSNEALLETRLSELNSSRQQLEADLDAGRVEQYNAAVPGFNSQVEAYNSLLEQARSLVSEHNDLVAQRNDLAVKVEDLNAALDSRLTPQ